MGECGYCESNVYQGHAPGCIYRCQFKQGDEQCEGSPNHNGPHGQYGPELEDDFEPFHDGGCLTEGAPSPQNAASEISAGQIGMVDS